MQVFGVKNALFFYNGIFIEKTVGKRLHINIALLCKRWGWAMDKLGERLGLGRNAVRNYIAGTTEPTLERMLTLEKWTGVSVKRLYYGFLTLEDFPEFPDVNAEDWLLREDKPQYELPSSDQPASAALVDISALVAEVQALRADRERDRGRIEGLEGLVMALRKEVEKLT